MVINYLLNGMILHVVPLYVQHFFSRSALMEANVVLNSDTAQYVGSTSGTKAGNTGKIEAGKQVKTQKFLALEPSSFIFSGEISPTWKWGRLGNPWAPWVPKKSANFGQVFDPN